MSKKYTKMKPILETALPFFSLMADPFCWQAARVSSTVFGVFTTPFCCCQREKKNGSSLVSYFHSYSRFVSFPLIYVCIGMTTNMIGNIILLGYIHFFLCCFLGQGFQIQKKNIYSSFLQPIFTEKNNLLEVVKRETVKGQTTVPVQ